MLTSKSNSVWTSIAFALSIITVGFAIWLFLNRQFVLDQLAVWSYQPTASIKQLDEQVQFTDKGQFTFYATKPTVASPSEFNNKCPRQETGSPVLGCYTPDGRIYVFDISNEQLNGMEEVTAAHEMLHAAWQRLDTAKQAEIGALITKAYETKATTELRDRMAYYQRNEPDALTNELHSILGTEMADLGPELEAYYANYFKDRQLILALHDKYNAVYQALYTRADSLYAQMEALSANIEARSTAYDANVAQLTADIASFNSRANNGSFNSVAQFNIERAALVRRSSQLGVERTAINNDIVTYNAMHEEYQTIASQIEVLNNSIDSIKALGEAPTVQR